MRRSPRFSIAGLMAVVLIASFSLAALRSASPTWASGLYLLTLALLALALVGAACREASERARWLGFALFGLGYHRWAFVYYYGVRVLPTTRLLEIIKPEGVGPYEAIWGGPSSRSSVYYYLVGHCLWSLLAATIGGVLAHALFDTPALPPTDADVYPSRGGQSARAGWPKFAAAGLASLVTSSGLMFLVLRSDPALWVGAVYILTWCALGLSALGFACRRGPRRMVWFGAALFGLGYMILNRGPTPQEPHRYVHIVSEQFLSKLRPWLPPIVSGFPADTAAEAAANARVKKALEQTIPMTFPDPVTLEDLVKYIRAATRGPGMRPISIHADPIELIEAEETMRSRIQIDVEGQPLRTTLRLALKQLGMVYDVRDGMVPIISEPAEDTPIDVDYYLLLGHCVLAWLAAALGALLVPLVSDRSAGTPA